MFGVGAQDVAYSPERDLVLLVDVEAGEPLRERVALAFDVLCYHLADPSLLHERIGRYR